MTNRFLTTTLALCVIILMSTMGGIGSHEERIDERIVHPYGLQVITHVPVVAGYEPYPTPMHCDAGAPLLNEIVYHDDFEGANTWSFESTSLSASGVNLWQVTDFEAAGEPLAGNRLYFGNTAGPSIGTFQVDNEHLAGTAQSGPIALPASGDAVLTFTTKWQMEYLAGYDHMWVELLDESGRIHLLCSNNAAGRVDAMGVGGSSLYASCSPFHFSPCPAGFGLGVPEPELGFPAWETRSIEIPESLLDQTVRIQFTFDSSDGAANWFLGWMIDDVTVGVA